MFQRGGIFEEVDPLLFVGLHLADRFCFELFQVDKGRFPVVEDVVIRGGDLGFEPVGLNHFMVVQDAVFLGPIPVKVDDGDNVDFGELSPSDFKSNSSIIQPSAALSLAGWRVFLKETVQSG